MNYVSIFLIPTGHGPPISACVSMQIEADKYLLWLACRHHVGEVILTWVWDRLKIEVSKSPEIVIFKR